MATGYVSKFFSLSTKHCRETYELGIFIKSVLYNFCDFHVWVKGRMWILPWCVVGHHLVEVVDGDHVLGDLLVIGYTGVLEPVAPQDLIGKIGGSNLKVHNIQALRTVRI